MLVCACVFYYAFPRALVTRPAVSYIRARDLTFKRFRARSSFITLDIVVLYIPGKTSPHYAHAQFVVKDGLF